MTRQTALIIVLIAAALLLAGCAGDVCGVSYLYWPAPDGGFYCLPLLF